MRVSVTMEEYKYTFKLFAETQGERRILSFLNVNDQAHIGLIGDDGEGGKDGVDSVEIIVDQGPTG